MLFTACAGGVDITDGFVQESDVLAKKADTVRVGPIMSVIGYRFGLADQVETGSAVDADGATRKRCVFCLLADDSVGIWPGT